MSYLVPEDLKFTKEHEWIKIQDDVAIIGITDFAQSSLGDIVFVELPDVGRNLSQNETFGVVESIKSVSDLYSPISGEVVEINQEIESGPESCNQEPYDSWLVKIRPNDMSELEKLFDAQTYITHCEELS